MVLRAVELHLQVLPYLLHRQLVVVVSAALVGPLLDLQPQPLGLGARLEQLRGRRRRRLGLLALPTFRGEQLLLQRAHLVRDRARG